jgi:adenylate cyclase
MEGARDTTSLLRRWVKAGGIIVPLAVIIAAALAATLAVHNVTFLLYLEQVSEDVRTALYMPSEAQDPDITIVTIDEDTLAQFPYREPIDRRFLADLIRHIAARGPRLIAVDVFFDQPTEPAKDDLLRQTLRTLSIPLVVSYTDNPAIENDDQKAYLDDFVPPAARAMATLATDPSDTTRRIFPGETQSDGSYIPGFARAVAGKLGVATPAVETVIVWHGKPDNADSPFRKCPALAATLLGPEWFKDKIVLIGSDFSLNDRHRTPFASVFEGSKGFLPGIFIHAHSIAQLLDHRPPDQLSWLANFAIALGLAAIGAVLGRIDLRLLSRIAAAASLVALLIVAGFELFHLKRTMIELAPPSLSLAMAMWMSDSLGGREARRQREYIKTEFSRYVSPKIVNQLIDDPSRLSLDRRVMTFIFTDVANFTTLSEAIGSEELSRVLNAYLDGVCRVVLAFDGTVDKFIGDAVFSIFNAPTEQPDHRERAVNCALAIDAYAEAFRIEQNARGIPFGTTRIGVHSGEATIGNFGSLDRREYTALGDPVNTASRLEGVNKYLGTRICVSDVTKAGCPTIPFRPIGLLTLKGKVNATAVFEPQSESDAATDYTIRYFEAYSRLAQRDPAALDLFAALHAELPDDGAVSLHLGRLHAGESGVEIVMTEK